MSSIILKSIANVANDINDELKSNESYFEEFVKIYDKLNEISDKLKEINEDDLKQQVESPLQSESSQFSDSDLIKAEINFSMNGKFHQVEPLDIPAHQNSVLHNNANTNEDDDDADILNVNNDLDY